ncbi:nucleoporin GLE1 KNAG_0A02410 [Huiozyma naganishii CBS 8797]|uniref:mRNA export factor GLE1 n=1 Tax=Huiozyma naganishii (strain ATCC MYA-139 / BCRC 22969 / CBS 8797 / KCTC 17520 / NBRC 10181 / NCYC 3082 / Yp74L-3) TaxID=1071383 RepID=J7QZL7_HUIN7|nr:hypothetical protein KNAG_0A02410 [Kazachstania naganishii CBS 8797]CCK67930.1 hypothetical protein KNAG_0A02410 [Kazachstania naganishii CBS 8797]
MNPQLENLLLKLDIGSKFPFSLNEPVKVRLPRGPLEEPAYKLSDDENFSSDRDELDNPMPVLPIIALSDLQGVFKDKLARIRSANENQVAVITEEKRQLEIARKREEERLKAERELREKREREERERREREAAKSRKRQEEEEREERKRQEQLKIESAKREASQGKYVTSRTKIEETFWHYKNKVVEIKQTIAEPAKALPKDIKSLLSQHKRKINPKFGQLTNSLQQLTAIKNELNNLIGQCKAAPNPLIYPWILNFCAKAIVHQAETEVRVKPESATPLAKLSCFLLQQFPELGELLMARFVKKCPYVIGYTCAIETEKGRSSMGWKRKSDDKWESDTSYDERMAGMMTLFAAITMLPESNQQPVNEKWSVVASWQIVARMANLPTASLTNTHFILLGAWWDSCAFEFLGTFGNQADKLLRLVGDALTQSVNEHKFVGAARLRILYEDYVQNRTIKQFQPMDQ